VNELLVRLQEVGRVVSAANATKLQAAITALQAVLAMNEADRGDAQFAVIAEAEQLLEAAKTEGGIAFPPEAYAYVPDPKMPFGWKLRLWEDLTKKETPSQVGAAVAAFSPGGFRGKQVQIPAADVSKVKARVRAAWTKVNPDKKPADMPASLAEAGFMSYNDIRSRLSTALKARMNVPDSIEGPWVQDVYDDRLIYNLEGKYFQLDYSMDDKGNVTLGDPFEVMQVTTYEPVTEAGTEEFSGDFVPLEESFGKDGITEIKIIQPGWGSSGYYSKEMLTRDAAIYKPGTKMYWDHPTVTEETDRPERSLRDLAAEITSPGVFKEQGPRGPGVYAQAQVFAPYRASVQEMAPHIGLSHRALGKAVAGEAEGKKGPIIEKLVAAKSVDFVTTPGAGGEVVQMFEAARPKADVNDKTDKGKGDTATHEEAKRMSDEKLTELEEANKALEETNKTLDQDNRRLKETQILREAHDMAADKVGKSELPDITKDRLVESLSKSPVIKEGALDIDEYGKAIDEAIKAEIDYVAKLTESGKIKGMGASDSGDGKTALKESFKATFLREGKSEEEAERMADIAARGR
jgi:hypothetical protein